MERLMDQRNRLTRGKVGTFSPSVVLVFMLHQSFDGVQTRCEGSLVIVHGCVTTLTHWYLASRWSAYIFTTN